MPRFEDSDQYKKALEEYRAANPPDPLEKQIETYKSEAKRANDEAAERRVTLQAERKRRYALEQVLKAHNINVNVGDLDISKLEVKDNEVQGQVPYKPPVGKPESSNVPPTKPKPGNGALTLEELETMPRDQIMDRWKDVTTVLKNS